MQSASNSAVKPAVTLEGLDALSARLARLAAAPGLDEALRRSAEMVRDEAERRIGQGDRSASALASSLEVISETSGDMTRFVVGTVLAEGRRAEFGTRGRRAAPFLLPALHAALPSIKQQIGNAVAAAAKSAAVGRKGR